MSTPLARTGGAYGAEPAVDTIRARLRATDVAGRVGLLRHPSATSLIDAVVEGGVAFAASSERMERRFYDAVRELAACIKPTAGSAPILNEGGAYHGCWLESTGTISAERLSRFAPEVAGNTLLAFARHQRADGLLPYKLTGDGPVFSQIQLVSPPARAAWTHYSLGGRDRDFLRTIYDALARYDLWLATWRDTRGTGGVEAFCAYDTGHDLSARFWHVPDAPFGNDPAACNPDNPVLPFVAPDLTASVACGRFYLARMAEELGEDGTLWREKGERSLEALFDNCYDRDDGFFYDLDCNGRHIRVQSDVLLRVLACEVGDDAFFAQALDRYLLNTRKFFAKYPFTSVALDDPRFDPAYDYNSWCGPSNFLSLIRAPHAFEAHGRHVELTWAMRPALAALFKSTRFSQTIHPFTGREGFTETYSPAILCLLDFVERLCGIQERPDGDVWFTGLVPYEIEHRDVTHQTAYARTIAGNRFELVNGPGGTRAFRNGEGLFTAPLGIRVVTDREGGLVSVIGMQANTVEGTIETPDGRFPFRAAPNQQLDMTDGGLVSVRDTGLVPPNY